MTPTVGNFRMASDLNGISSMQQNQYLINKNMTPTPEEVKDRVAVKHGWFNWNQAMRSGKRKDFLLLENEAMQEYALAFHKAELEKLITKTNKI